MTFERLKELAKPIGEGLMGKPRDYSANMPHYKVRPVGMIVEDLVKIPEEDWYKYAFSRELLNGKFNDEQRLDLTRKAIACGREYAHRMIEECGNRDPEIIAKHLGANVTYPMMPQSTDRVLFAEFREPNNISIYMDGVEKGKVLMGDKGVPHALTGQLDIAKLLLGHELFHMVEKKYKKEIFTQTYKIELWGKFPIHNRSTITQLGEIAAMAFTQELNRLPYSPYVMDAYLVYGYSPDVASGLYEEMMEYAGRTPRQPEDWPEIAASAVAEQSESV